MSDFRPSIVANLPIFRLDEARRSIFYTPGYVVAVDAGQAEAFEARLASPTPDDALAGRLVQHAAAARSAWNELHSRPFEPLCLTLYLNNECNLACTYCFSAPSAPSRTSARISLDTVRAAAEIVAVNCANRKRPLSVVFHGGGEPTLDQRQVDVLLNALEAVAEAHGLPIFRYIATNGVLSATKAAWLARHFDLIGLSCDGPAEIQARQRPLRSKRSTNHRPSEAIERTAFLVHQASKPLHVRVSITPATIHRQDEIAEYVCHQLRPQEVHVEPVYRGRQAVLEDTFEAQQAEDFVAGFWQARQIAQQHGILWQTSGARPAEIHGPYCQIWRDVLQLVPGDVAAACFKMVNAGQARQQGRYIGQMDHATGHFLLDSTAVQQWRAVLSQVPQDCQECFNRYHCTRACPDNCPAEDRISADGMFRCRVTQLLAKAEIQALADAEREN